MLISIASGKFQRRDRRSVESWVLKRSFSENQSCNPLDKYLLEGVKMCAYVQQEFVLPQPRHPCQFSVKHYYHFTTFFFPTKTIYHLEKEKSKEKEMKYEPKVKYPKEQQQQYVYCIHNIYTLYTRQAKKFVQVFL